MTASSKASSCARHLAHARIVELDLAPARAMPGVSAAISLLGDDRMVRYVGAADCGRRREGPKDRACRLIAAIRLTANACRR